MSAQHLLSADPDLAEGIPEQERALATRLLVAESVSLPPGPWDPESLRDDDVDGFALLVLRGALTREVHLAGRRSAELVGPGDVIRPSETTDSLLPHHVTWTATQPTVVAVLDERFRQASRRWPALAVAIEERLLAQIDRLAVHVAIAQLGRVDVRLLALFWHLADRWGRVTVEGVTVPLRLTHDALGRLVGAQRPTVTLALAELGRSGAVRRSTSGGWLLRPDARALLEADAAPATGLAPAARARVAALAG